MNERASGLTSWGSFSRKRNLMPFNPICKVFHRLHRRMGAIISELRQRDEFFMPFNPICKVFCCLRNRIDTVISELRQRDEFFKWARIGIPKDSYGIYAVGWIPGKEEDRRKLRQIGVRGRMIFSRGCFEKCVASEEVMRRLLVAGWLEYPVAFTKVNFFTGIQLPYRKQSWWRWPDTIRMKHDGYI